MVQMSSNVRGLYRTPGRAFVTDDIMAFAIPKAEYQECGYVPDYDTLPAKDAYSAGRPPKSKGGKRT